MKTRGRAAVVVVLSLVMGATPVLAKGLTAPEHFHLGEEAFERGDYETALTEMTAAWEIDHNPILLLDLARVETKLGHEARAIGYLKQYVEVAPEARDAVSVRAEIRARELALEQQQRLAQAEAQANLARAEVTNARQSQDRRRQEADRRTRTSLRIGGYVSLALGLAALGGGVACGVLSTRDSDTVTHGGAAAPSSGGTPVPFTGSYSDAQNQAHVTQPLGIALDVVGGALVATGVALVVYAWRRPPRTVAAQLTPGLGVLRF